MTDEREAVRFGEFLDRELGPFLAEHPDVKAFETKRAWQRLMADHRWVGLSWPERDGGRGLDIRARVACEALAARRGAPSIAGVLGVNNIGPTIAHWGTDEQRAHLPSILSGAEIWCQGFSEPEAGSDLRDLRSKAVRTGGGWRLRGQKVWTSSATDATWCALLARAVDGEEDLGITCFLVPLDRPGVTVRGLRQLTGDSEFGELFFDDVELTEADRLGPAGQGWKVANTTLGHERANTVGLISELVASIGTLAGKARGRTLRAQERDELIGCFEEGQLLHLVALRLLADAEAGTAPGAEPSLLKLGWSRGRQRAARLGYQLDGPQAWEGEALPPAVWEYLRSRGSTIAAGTSEIILNILAERVLGMPRERKATR
ncbi:alkylation response protein AidB-like acyl-CoA dehydrogenase [Amycolatopsis bartoniae]|uniref:Acyl-CoA dehydrogenase n=1 Tax=Amycolatopsis bartoniae TaxID=941986 RepID=A0A8H9M8M4_9PSEU|nr:acyl-CoA dehydrogenase family protein [Amycolatopsis bartoniae]MBB2939949.1 alkylation response protein AidB-like acyl-CoA dehydrogenase [Amycolatopsis bartoniae]TVT10127.1 hypothetical protein FNH07_05965 [Amycolatopsis bartoniae]GHF35534.1 acyl-CoA dehydrogenase [Amycolatopsis bartoniae]